MNPLQVQTLIIWICYLLAVFFIGKAVHLGFQSSPGGVLKKTLKITVLVACATAAGLFPEMLRFSGLAVWGERSEQAVR